MRANPIAPAVVLWLLSVVGAWAQAPHPLTNIGSEPFTGDHQTACELHVAADLNLSMVDCLSALALADDSNICPAKPVLTEGSVWRMLFTDHQTGVHRLGLAVIAFGDNVPADDERRMANDCSGIAGGMSFVKPHACGNYALRVPMSIPEEDPDPSPVTGKVTTFITDVVPFPLALGGNSCCTGCCCDANGVEVDATGPAYNRTIIITPADNLPGSETPYGEASSNDY